MALHVTISPDRFSVAEPCSVEVRLRCAGGLEIGDAVEFQFPNSWCLVSGPTFTRPIQATDSAAAHYVSISAPGSDAEFRIDIRPRQLNCPEGLARHGRHVVGAVSRGRVPPGREIVICYANTFAPYVAEAETLWLRVKGEAPDQPVALKTQPGPHQGFRVIVPSGVEPGEPFDVLIASLDRFDNASNTPFVNQPLLRNDGQVVAAGVSFTGSVRVPASVDRPGVYRFRFGGAVSNAVRVAAGRRGPFWGDLHIHTKLSGDGQGCDPYGYAREVSGLDFAAAIDHRESLGEEGYRVLETWAGQADRPGRFAAILGDERNPPALTGHHNIYFRDLESFRRFRALPAEAGAASGGPSESKSVSGSPDQEAKLLAGLDPARVMLIPHHTGMGFRTLPKDGLGCAVNWEAWADPGLRPVMEVYSHHGQCELYCPEHALAYELNRQRNSERRFNVSVPGPYYARDHWMAGRRIGVIGSSDEHSGQGGRRHGGVAAAFAPELTREAIFDAVRARRCYATTGERILLDFTVDGAAMGQAARRPPGSTLKIALKVWATEVLLRVDILRFRFGVDSTFLPILSEGPRPESTDASYELSDVLSGPTVYFARVVQEPIAWPGMAWASPIWIDSEP